MDCPDPFYVFLTNLQWAFGGALLMIVVFVVTAWVLWKD